jgi:hypothetical protein
MAVDDGKEGCGPAIPNMQGFRIDQSRVLVTPGPDRDIRSGMGTSPAREPRVRREIPMPRGRTPSNAGS